MPGCEIDHIVVAAASLEEGVRFVRERLGCDIPRGGRHPYMGTHNSLMRLGSVSFFEVISIDPDAAKPNWPRWFELDEPEMQAQLATSPRLVTWVVRVPDIEARARASTVALGPILPLNRDALTWRLTVPEDGRRPGNGVLPHLIAWDHGARPWERMAECGCRLEQLKLRHPNPDAIGAALRSIGAEGLTTVEVEYADEPGLTARIRLVSGEIVELE